MIEHERSAAALIVLALGLATACDSPRRSEPDGGSAGSIAADSSTPGSGHGGAKSADGGAGDASTTDAEATGAGGTSSTFSLMRDGADVVVSEIYRLCSDDADCILVGTSCNGCCGQDAIAHERQSNYAEELTVACRDYEGPICDCEPKPLSARCVSARCRALDDSATCYSPTQNGELAFHPGVRGCACELEGQRICVQGVAFVCQRTFPPEPAPSRLEWKALRDERCDFYSECPEVDRRPTAEACLREYVQCEQDGDLTFCGEHCYGPLDCSALACDDYEPPSSFSCEPEGGPWEGVCVDGSVRYRITHTGQAHYWDHESGALLAVASPAAPDGACNGSDAAAFLGDTSLLARCTVLTDDGTSVCLQDRCSDTVATRVAGGCELALSAPLPTNASCRALVALNGQVLACNDPNGWTGLDRFHIRLDGEACSALQAGDPAVVRVQVPCGGVAL